MKRFLVAAFKAITLVLLVPVVFKLYVLANATVIAYGVREEVETSFYAEGQADSLCENVLERRGAFATCDAFLASDGAKVTLRGYVMVFSSRELAERDLVEKRNADAIGAMLLRPTQGLPLKTARSLYEASRK